MATMIFVALVTFISFSQFCQNQISYQMLVFDMAVKILISFLKYLFRIKDIYLYNDPLFYN